MGRENRMNAVNEISVPPHSDYHINTKRRCKKTKEKAASRKKQ